MMEQAARTPLAGCRKVQPADPKQKRNKSKFRCDLCGRAAWGRPDLDLTCNYCGAPMPSAEGNQ